MEAVGPQFERTERRQRALVVQHKVKAQVFGDSVEMATTFVGLARHIGSSTENIVPSG